MSVSDPSWPSGINCDTIRMYTEYPLLKVTMVTQATFGILSIISMALTLRKSLTTIIVDRAFKEYIVASYAVQLVLCTALIVLQFIFLYTHLFSAPCAAYISAQLCSTMRIITSTNSILPLLNVSLAMFRFCVLRFVSAGWSECIWLHRVFQLLAILAGIGYQLYRFVDTRVDGNVVYCVGNNQDGNVPRLIQNVWTSVCEGFSLVFGIYLYRCYKNSERTFIVNCSLIRRQAIQTFHLFISFNMVQAVCFLGYAAISQWYWKSGFTEPLYSAANGLFFIPMYFSTFSPWLIYYIISREEKKRVRKTNDLLSKENNGTDVCFHLIPMYFSTFSPWLIYYIISREEKKRVRKTNDLLSKENNGTDVCFHLVRAQWDAPTKNKKQQSRKLPKQTNRVAPS